MATIQIRDIPEDAYEVLRRRARVDGRSIQAYMRQQVVELASRPTKAEHLVAIEEVLAHSKSPQPSAEQIVADVAADRR